jgi:hypothetical protein
MQTEEISTQEKPYQCQSCIMRGEKLQAIGVSIFFLSLFSFGLLLPFSLLAAIVIQTLSLRKCKECRDRVKQQRRAKRESQSLR